MKECPKCGMLLKKKYRNHVKKCVADIMPPKGQLIEGMTRQELKKLLRDMRKRGEI